MVNNFNLVNSNLWDRVTSVKNHTKLLDEVDTLPQSYDFQFFSAVEGWSIGDKLTIVGSYFIDENNFLNITNNTEIYFNIPNDGYVRLFMMRLSGSYDRTFRVDDLVNINFQRTYSRYCNITSFIKVTSGDAVIKEIIIKSLNQDAHQEIYTYDFQKFSIHNQVGYFDLRGRSCPFRNFRHSKTSYVYLNYIRGLFSQSYQRTGTRHPLMQKYFFNPYDWLRIQPDLLNTSFYSKYIYSRDSVGYKDAPKLDEFEGVPAYISNAIFSKDLNSEPVENIQIRLRDCPRENSVSWYERLQLSLTDAHSSYYITFLESIKNATWFRIQHSGNTYNEINILNPIIDWVSAGFESLEDVVLSGIKTSKLNLSNLLNSAFNFLATTRRLHIRILPTEQGDIDISHLTILNQLIVTYRLLSFQTTLNITFPQSIITLNQFIFEVELSRTSAYGRADGVHIYPQKIIAEGGKSFTFRNLFAINLCSYPEIDLTQNPTQSQISYLLEPVGSSIGLITVPSVIDFSFNISIRIKPGNSYAENIWDQNLNISDMSAIENSTKFTYISISYSSQGSSFVNFIDDLLIKLSKFKEVYLYDFTTEQIVFPPSIIETKIQKLYIYTVNLTNHYQYSSRLIIPKSPLVQTYFNLVVTQRVYIDLSNIDFRDVDSDTFITNNNFYHNFTNAFYLSVCIFKKIQDSLKENNHSFTNIYIPTTLNYLDFKIGEDIIFQTVITNAPFTCGYSYPLAIALKRIYDNALKFKPRPNDSLQDTADFPKTLNGFGYMLQNSIIKPDGYIQANLTTEGNDGIVKFPKSEQETTNNLNIYFNSTSDWMLRANFLEDGDVPGSLKIKILNNTVPVQNCLIVLIKNSPYGLLRSQSSLGLNQIGNILNVSISNPILVENCLFTNELGEAEIPMIEKGSYWIYCYDANDLTLVNDPVNHILTEEIVVGDNSIYQFELIDYKKVAVNSPITLTFEGVFGSVGAWSLYCNGKLLRYDFDVDSRFLFLKTGNNTLKINCLIPESLTGLTGNTFLEKEIIVNYNGTDTSINIDLGNEYLMNYNIDVFNFSSINLIYILSKTDNMYLYIPQSSNVRNCINSYGGMVTDSYLRQVFEFISDSNNKNLDFKEVIGSPYSNNRPNNNKYQITWREGLLAYKMGFILYKNYGFGDEPVFYLYDSASGYQLFSNIQGITKVKLLLGGVSCIASQYAYSLINQKKDFTETLKYRWSIT